MRVGAASADQDGLDAPARGGGGSEVRLEGEAHGGGGVAREGEVVLAGGFGDEGVDGGEGVGWGDEDRGYASGEVGVGGEEGKVEDQEDEAVFAAVVGEGEGGEAFGVGCVL